MHLPQGVNSLSLQGEKRSRTETPLEQFLKALANILMKNYFDEAMTYGNLRKALNRCCRNVRWKDSVVGYELHAPQNTHKLLESIKNGTYKISPYQHFIIYEPKRREITATRIQDRQVQMALCEGDLPDGTAMNSLVAWGSNAKRGDAYFRYKRMKYFYYSTKAGIKNGYYAGTPSESRKRCTICDVGSCKRSGKYRLLGNDVRHRNSY